MAEQGGASDSLSTPQSDAESETDAEGEIQVQVFPWPGFEAWQAQIGSLQEAMRRGEVRKVVLARTLRLISTRSWNAERAFQLLLRAFPHAYPFFFRFDDQSAFFGVTPERLARVENGILQTMALAGSLPRGATPEEDARLTQKLLQDDRLRLEHQIVVEYIAQALQPLTRSLTLSDVQPLRLPNVQHLQVHIQGLLREGYDVLDAIQALHPTAALGGQPREAALQWIERLEPFERGWYGAPLGWVDSEGSGDFLVALRCGWVRDREALLFAGSGILPQSNARAEWEETALKFRPMLQALEGSLAVKAG
jgi:isochorismate synthase